MMKTQQAIPGTSAATFKLREPHCEVKKLNILTNIATGKLELIHPKHELKATVPFPRHNFPYQEYFSFSLIFSDVFPLRKSKYGVPHHDWH